MMMASCDPFNVTFKGDAKDLYDKLVKLASQHNGKIIGNATQGTFEISIPVVGHFAGAYAVSGQTCTVHVTERPFLISCAFIEEKVREFLPNIEKAAIAEI
jgi:hypothetical protein